VRLSQGVRRIDIETEIVNQEKHVRYQVLFPTTIAGGHNVQEIPFGSVERPMGVEYPAQNWVDLGDGHRGVAVLNRGLAGNVAADGTLMVSLLRSEDLLGYNEGRASATGFELGVARRFHYALVSHAGDFRDAAVYRHGLDFNSPLLVRKVALHGGELPPRLSLLAIADPHVVLTACKPGPDGATIVRVYDASGLGAKGVKLKAHGKIVEAHESDLLESRGQRLEPDADGIHFDLHPFQILTLRLTLAAAGR
jgi:alpha-mannosidase